MGGYGSGRRRFDSKTTASYYRRLDVRQLQRAGALKPGWFGSWQWSRNGERVAYIQLRSETGRVWLTYKHRQNDGPWKTRTILWPWNGHPVITAAHGPGFDVRRICVGGVL